MSVIEEFKKFALKGNVVDLAIGVIIGAAFGKIVASLVDNIITPPLGLIIGGVDFSQLKLVIAGASEGKPEVAIGYGIFIQQCFNFMIVAFALFFLIKMMNRMQRQKVEAPAPPAPTPEDVLLLREIRDSLRK